jgi:hypothetical protein
MRAGKTPEEVRYALSEEAAAAAQAQNPGIANLPKVPKSKQQVRQPCPTTNIRLNSGMLLIAQQSHWLNLSRSCQRCNICIV